MPCPNNVLRGLSENGQSTIRRETEEEEEREKEGKRKEAWAEEAVS